MLYIHIVQFMDYLQGAAIWHQSTEQKSLYCAHWGVGANVSDPKFSLSFSTNIVEIFTCGGNAIKILL